MSASAAPEGVAALRALEQRLEAHWRGLLASGHGYAAVQEQLRAGKPGDDEELADFLRAADAAQQSFLASLDEFQRVKHVYFVNEVAAKLDTALEMVERFYGGHPPRRVRREGRRLQKLAEQYRELEPLYGTPQDHRRIATFQRFYAGLIRFAARLRELDPTMPPPPRHTLGERAAGLRRGLGRAVRHIPAWLRLIGAGLRIAALLFSRRSDAPERGSTPLTRRVDELFRALGDLRDFEVVVRRGEHADERQSDVTLYTPTHRHGTLDNIAFSHVALSDYLVFNAVDQLRGFPKALKDRAADTPGLIAVGGGRGPSVERAIDALRTGVSRNILIYPEGSVSEGFKGTRPPRPQFGEKLVRAIRDAGFSLRIVPIAYLDNARFLDLPPVSRDPSERELRVEVSAALDDAMIGSLLHAGGGAMVGRMLRMCWLAELTTDARRFLGADRVAEIERRLDLELDGIHYWGSLDPAPVDDVLPLACDEPMEARDEAFRGRRVRVFRIPDAARVDHTIPVPSLDDADSNELLLGVRPPSHIYLSVGRHRFDGDIFRPLSVKERTHVYPGIVVRFVGMPRKSLNAIRRHLEGLAGRERRTLTCANSACQVIARAANLRIDDHADLRPFLPSHVLPTRTLRKLIERGVRDHLGGRVDYQIYKTDDRTLEEILAEMRREERRIFGDHVRFLTAGAWQALRRSLGRGRV